MRPMHTPMSLHRRLAVTASVAALAGAAFTASAATTPAGLLARYQGDGPPASAARGRAFFTEKHGGDWACASCHGDRPAGTGRHAATGKPIEPMAPAANARRFTDEAKVEKWFRRNCRDVVQRECSAAEKADVLAFLIEARP